MYYENEYQAWKLCPNRKTISRQNAIVNNSNIYSAYKNPSTHKKEIWFDIEYFTKHHKGICGIRSYNVNIFTASAYFEDMNNITGEIESVFVNFFPSHTDFYLVK